MKMNKNIYFLLLLFVVSCREHYESPVKQNSASLLVVEGIINTGKTGGTTITLSRTTNLRQPVIDFVKGAVVQVESDNNQLFLLSEKPNGVYSDGQLRLDSTRKYRLVIKTAGKEYRSAFTQAKTTPPIDSISWKQENNGLQITVNTHDPKDATRYYRWDYVQTW